MTTFIRSWWPWAAAVLALPACIGLAWLVLGYQPHTLSDLARQMVAVLVIVISLGPVLLIDCSEGSRP